MLPRVLQNVFEMPLGTAETDQQLISPQVMVRRKGVLLAAFQSLGQVLAVCPCTWQESPEEGFLHWIWEVCVRWGGGAGDSLPQGLGRPDIPELSGGCQMCLSLRALLPTQCSRLQDGWLHR